MESKSHIVIGKGKMTTGYLERDEECHYNEHQWGLGKIKIEKNWTLAKTYPSII
jgi:hypothetical protein